MQSARREDRIQAALARHGAERARLAIVAGSGLSALADGLDEPRVIPFSEVDGMPASSVPGHAGRFVLGSVEGTPVLVQQGRVHLYEGFAPDVVTASVRAFAALGIQELLLTNAAGSLVQDRALPALMRIDDHLSFQGIGALRRGEEARGCPYDPELGQRLADAAEGEGLELHRGVYAATLGPVYESPAEIRMMRGLGASAVGMSTVAEASAAHVSGVRVAALSCLTNPAAGLAQGPLTHDEVVAAGRAVAERATRLVRRFVARSA